MEIRVLRYFLTVVREESITRAPWCCTSPSPRSAVSCPDGEEMGVGLFDRGSRKIALTSEGMLLRRRAEEILELVDKTEKELTEQDEMVEGTVSIGFGVLAAVRMLRRFSAAFMSAIRASPLTCTRRLPTMSRTDGPWTDRHRPADGAR